MAALVDVLVCAMGSPGSGEKGLLESDVGVSDDQRAQDGVHDGVEGAGGERSDGEGNEADGDQSVIEISSCVPLGLRHLGALGRK